VAVAMPAERKIFSLSAITVQNEPADLEDKTHKLGAQGAHPEGKTSSIGRSSCVLLKVWSDTRRNAEKLRKQLLAAKGATILDITLLLLGFTMLATIAFVYAAHRMSAQPVEETRSVVQPPSLQRLSPAASLQPQGRSSTGPLGPLRRSVLPTRPRPPRTTSVSVVSSAPAPLAVASPTAETRSSSPTRMSALCPGLVVPDSCECMLLLPRMERESSRGGATINDLNGIPVLKAEYRFPNRASDRARLSLGSHAGARGQSVDEAKPCLLLLTLTEDETVFASCRESSRGSLLIQDSSNRVFGEIRPQAPEVGMGCEIRFGSGSIMHVAKTAADEVSITDHYGRVVALTELISKQPEQHAVRVGPFTDAGLVVLVLLAVELLKHAHAEA